MNIRERVMSLSEAREAKRRELSGWGKGLLRRNILAGIFAVVSYIVGTILLLHVLRG